MKDFLSLLAVDLFAGAYMCFNALTPVATSKIKDNLFAVQTGPVNFYLYKDGENTICFDSGFGAATVKRELRRLAIAPENISHVFLTHSDFDHAGGLSVLKDAKVYLSEAEEQMLTGKTARRLGFIHNAKIKQGYHLLSDNAEVMVGSIKVKAIETPGHTPGSMCYLVNDSLLFTGDAFRIINGSARPIRRVFTMNMKNQLESIRKLARLKAVRMILTAHRGFSRDFDSVMRDWR